MPVNRVTEETSVTLAEVKDIISKRTKESEATYEQKQTMEYVKEFARVPTAKAKDAVEKIIALDVDRKQAIKIVDILPDDADDMKLIFAKAHYSVNEETTEKILDIIRGIR